MANFGNVTKALYGTFHGVKRLRRNALVTTETELSAMAAPAKTGDSSKPNAG